MYRNRASKKETLLIDQTVFGLVLGHETDLAGRDLSFNISSMLSRIKNRVLFIFFCNVGISNRSFPGDTECFLFHYRRQQILLKQIGVEMIGNGRVSMPMNFQYQIALW